MPLLDDARRWVKDHFVHSPDINGTPKYWIAKVDRLLPDLVEVERLKWLDHLRGYATTYYHWHKESVPTEVRQQLNAMARTIDGLTQLDRARETLQKYGGPPSRETIAESLDRSFREREKQAERKSEAIRPEGESERESVGIRMRI